MEVVVVDYVAKRPVGIQGLLLEFVVQNIILVSENHFVFRAQGLPKGPQEPQFVLVIRLPETQSLHEVIEVDVFEDPVQVSEVGYERFEPFGENGLLRQIDYGQRNVDQGKTVSNDEVVENS